MPQAPQRVWVERCSLMAAMLLAALAALGPADAVLAQQEHYFHSADLPPGTVAQGQLLRREPLAGYFQPVEIQVPRGASVALAADGIFQPGEPDAVLTGMLIGPVYRLRITNIAFHEGAEVFPSIEIINRLYPPRGMAARFPIPIEITQQEIELALRGQYVTRVIYLEDPRTAVPAAEDPEQQRYFEVHPDQDPLRVADGLGRPMAILRMGSRVPDMDQASGRFLFDTPPWLRFHRLPEADQVHPAAWRVEPGAAGQVGDGPHTQPGFAQGGSTSNP